MSRIEFGGHEGPMPDIAIPDPHLSDHLPTQVLELTEDFAKADWMALGYTHYEVWCIGAAGGLGGGVLSDPIWAAKFYLLSAPSDIWAGHLAALVQGDAYLGKKFYSDYYTTIFSSVPLSMPHGYLSLASPATGYTGGYAYDVTHYQAEEYYNPSHLLGVQEYMSVFARQTGDAFGGAGGGGGLHVVSGELEDLPEVCEVVVGQVGVDGDPGQIKTNGLWSPSTPEVLSWYVRNSAAIPVYAPPQAGGDGGTSSFGGDICRASGGKGGNSAVQWIDGALYVDGRGGDGGVGDRDTPGGGAAGGEPLEIVYRPTLHLGGKEGTWDGTVGQGGGGGSGTTSVPDLGYHGPQSAL
jgi:hypothetical protein